MPYVRDRVIVLKAEPFREHDRRYVMYGRVHGLLEAVARGACRNASKQAGHLEPFTEAEVMLAKGSVFDKVAVAQARTSFWNVNFDLAESVATRARLLAGLVMCGAFVDLVIRLNRPGLADARIFELVRELTACAAGLPQSPSLERARLLHATATLRLLDLLGFGPDMHNSVSNKKLLSLLSFMRHASLSEVLRVSAPRDVLNSASVFVELAVQHTPLTHEPHGVKTIQTYLS